MSSFAEYNNSYGGNYILLSAGSGTVVGPVQIDQGQNVVGTIAATVSGLASLQQSFDGGQTWDVQFPITVTSGIYSFNQPSLGNTAHLVYTNGGNGQNGFFRAVVQSKTTGLI